MQVLLVSRHKMLVKTLKHGLEEEGFVVAVDSGELESHGFLSLGDHDVILLDIMKPAEGNLHRLAAWRRAGMNARVIALVAPGGDRKTLDADDATCDYLVAPFELEDLLARLRAVTPH